MQGAAETEACAGVDAIVEASERFGCRDEAPGITTPPGMRMNQSAHRMADLALLGPLFRRMSALLPARIDTMTLHPRLSERLNFGPQSAMHVGGPEPRYVAWIDVMYEAGTCGPSSRRAPGSGVA